MAEEVDVSMAPVKEALLILQGEGSGNGRHLQIYQAPSIRGFVSGHDRLAGSLVDPPHTDTFPDSNHCLLPLGSQGRK